MPDVAAALAYRSPGRIGLDPRTSFAALIVVNVVCLSAGFTGSALWSRLVATALPLVLLAAQRYWVAAGVCVAATAVALATETVGLDAVAGMVPAGVLGYAAGVGLVVAGALTNLLARVLPVALMGWYVVTTVRVGDLMGALARLHLPRVLIIPLAVVLRMIPVLAAESSAIGAAARTRGLRIGLARPATLVNYRIVPLSLRCVDIGDELTQAGLTRGLDAASRRSLLGRIGFRWPDAVVLVWAVGALVLFGLGW